MGCLLSTSERNERRRDELIEQTSKSIQQHGVHMRYIKEAIRTTTEDDPNMMSLVRSYVSHENSTKRALAMREKLIAIRDQVQRATWASALDRLNVQARREIGYTNINPTRSKENRRLLAREESRLEEVEDAVDDLDVVDEDHLHATKMRILLSASEVHHIPVTATRHKPVAFDPLIIDDLDVDVTVTPYDGKHTE